ncbi:MAG: MarR family transcriptional regulator [Lunatimonas sp.]|uniref:MarR family winged helix-turn-helix transcriptional regulator n=1 Tax=Lunatimonas sp. TaxID=2060141 RepID=UPI00263B4612|nr:MarR family transcriptional regulator [Lunatimonas sp.]MCC5936770.1 MarR family transcriptional regulator [Lunatimonas sp.]
MNDDVLKLENQICFPLYAASRLITKHYQPLLEELEVTYPQYLVLLLLWEKDRQKVTELGECLLLESSTLTPLLKRLEQKGFIHRARSQKDERQVIISLTDSGKLAKQAALPIPEKLLQSVQQGHMKPEDLTMLKSILDTFIRLNRG